MNRGPWLFLAALAVLGGCSSDSGSGNGEARACADDIAAGDWEIFGEPTPLFRSEGLVFDADGSLYVSAQDPRDDQVPNQLIEVSLDGSNQMVAEASSIHGLESDPMGILAAGIATANLLLFDVTDGSSEEIATGLGEPNFVVTTPWGTILVTDDRPEVGSILEVTWDGEVSVWNDEVPTPNGMVFSLDNSRLYVAATFEEEGLYELFFFLEEGEGWQKQEENVSREFMISYYCKMEINQQKFVDLRKGDKSFFVRKMRKNKRFQMPEEERKSIFL